jgi:hypothetical protein
MRSGSRLIDGPSKLYQLLESTALLSPKKSHSHSTQSSLFPKHDKNDLIEEG